MEGAGMMIKKGRRGEGNLDLRLKDDTQHVSLEYQTLNL